MKCGIKHELGGQTCMREKGHDGNCRCKAERMGGGAIMYSEWVSRNGKFHRHVGYYSIYPKNMSNR
jgi:hypothetical protein